MFLNGIIREGSENEDVVLDDVDLAIEKDPDTEEGLDGIANDVENLMMQTAMESASYFDGGEQAVKTFTESTEVKALVEGRKLSKKTFVRLGKNDDLKRRAHLASIIIAKEKKDPLFKALALNRVKERKLRNAIFTKYGNKAMMVAKRSQKQHIKIMSKMPALPAIRMN